MSLYSSNFLLIVILFALLYVYLYMDVSTIPFVQNGILTDKYVTVTTGSGRLGNQLFFVLDGYSIARKLNRQLYFEYNPKDADVIDQRFEHMNYIFPKLRSTYVLLKHGKVATVGHPIHVTSFQDASQWKNRTEDFLRINLHWGQTYEYLVDIENEVRDLLQFSPAIREYGEEILKRKSLNPAAKYVCAHIRKTDFVRWKADTPLPLAVNMVNHVANKYGYKNVALFGDDNKFMRQIVKELEQKHSFNKNNSFISPFSEGMDLYLSSQLCSSFILTSPYSSFGFFFGFLSKYQHKVHYLYMREIRLSKLIRPGIFPPAWKAMARDNVTNEITDYEL